MTKKNISVCFLTNYLTHHQEPFCLEMYKILGKGFTLIETDILPQERINLGYQSLGEKYNFVINATESTNAEREAMRISFESDVVIIGSAPDRYIKERIKKNKLTFRCAERIFKMARMYTFCYVLLHTLQNLLPHTHYLTNNTYFYSYTENF